MAEPSTLGRGLVNDLVTRLGVSERDAEQSVAFVLEQVVADLERCRKDVRFFAPVEAIGVGIAQARIEYAAERVTWRRRAARVGGQP